MFQLGSISSGTLRTEDLQESFAHAIKRLTEAPHYEQLAWLAIEDGSLDMVDELQEALNELCPPFVYFGTHPPKDCDCDGLHGSHWSNCASKTYGADFGFWPDHDALQDATSHAYANHAITVPVSDTREFEAEGAIVQVSDHGNVTVMDMERNVLWSVV